ncbi:hypothetical protein MKY42_32455 [Paenibacillus sp. FSL W7-1088]|uniref:hypothetical protein n=1 Tax=unclassified Paenibacillus TaxID=185978 RepID=UPI0015C58622|nr:hypothetical protein [Paenibacillus sp. E222]QLG37642.1 hypothetical protein HW560_05675 [Paenibacillus sp. E222]
MLKSIQIDTLHLVAKLTNDQKDELYDLIDFGKDFGEGFKVYWKGNAVYKHIIHSKEPFFMVFFEPRVRTGLWTKSHYDILVILQQEAIQSKPAILELIFNIGDWRVKRMDIAYDWSTPISQHFIWKNANVKKDEVIGNQNYYLYGIRSENRAVIYDKKLQLKQKKNIEIPEEHLTRLEIRIRPKLNNLSVSANNLEWLRKHLDKFIFVENAAKLSRCLKEQDRKAFRALRRNTRMDWSAYGGDSVKRRIREKAKEQSVNLFDLFMSHRVQMNMTA